jgi:beta-glucosidase
VIGPLADDARSALGNWAGAGRPEDAITLLEGLRRALPGTRVLHARGAPVDTADTSGFAEAERMAREAEAVLLVLGERENMSAEAASRASIELPGAQEALARAVTRAARAASPDKPVVAILMNGRPLAVPWLADSVPAVLEAWFLGVEHGHAVADIVLGDHNPSGKLPVSMPRATGQVPIYYGAKPTGRPPAGTEKYTSKYLDVHWTPQWPFGHGLSYTTFEYGQLSLSADSVRAGDSLVVRASVRNSGSRAGDEVVQLYLRDETASVTRPLRSLGGFARVSLAPGESREVRFTVRPADLSLYDLTMRRVVEPGAFTVYLGGSSEAGLEGRFHITGDTLVLAQSPPRLR